MSKDSSSNYQPNREQNQKNMCVNMEISFSSLLVLPPEIVQPSPGVVVNEIKVNEIKKNKNEENKNEENKIEDSSLENLLPKVILLHRFHYSPLTAEHLVNQLTIGQKYALCCGFSPKVFDNKTKNSFMTLPHLYTRPPVGKDSSFPKALNVLQRSIVRKAQIPGAALQGLIVPSKDFSVSEDRVKTLFPDEKQTRKETRSLEKAYFSGNPQYKQAKIQSRKNSPLSQKATLSHSAQTKISTDLVPVSRT